MGEEIKVEYGPNGKVLAGNNPARLAERRIPQQVKKRQREMDEASEPKNKKRDKKRSK
jgi:hypothetical protein